MTRTHNKKSIFFSWIVLLFTCSCNDTIEFVQYNSVENAEWKSNQIIKFNFEVQDTIAPKNLFLHLRNTSEYPFSNIYVITSLEFPDKTIVIDTLQYEMADETGKFLGRGIANTKESKLFYKEQKVFPQVGKYQFQIRQAMRKNGEVQPLNKLTGIQDIGFSIEKGN